MSPRMFFGVLGVGAGINLLSLPMWRDIEWAIETMFCTSARTSYKSVMAGLLPPALETRHT